MVVEQPEAVVEQPEVEQHSAKRPEVEVQENSVKTHENSCEDQTSSSLPEPEVKEETKSEDLQSLAESLMEDEDDQNDNNDATVSENQVSQNIQNKFREINFTKKGGVAKSSNAKKIVKLIYSCFL